jgi:hypothetical protein
MRGKYTPFECSPHQDKLPHPQTQEITSEQMPREYLKNWTPISLLNTTYKFLSSVLPKITHLNLITNGNQELQNW